MKLFEIIGVFIDSIFDPFFTDYKRLEKKTYIKDDFIDKCYKVNPEDLK